MEENKTIADGYFSIKASLHYGVILYELINGKEQVNVTEITDINERPIGKWDDLIFVGKVKRKFNGKK